MAVALLWFCWIDCLQNTIIAGSKHCEHTRVSVGLVPLTLMLQVSIDINNFELTGDPLKLIKQQCH